MNKLRLRVRARHVHELLDLAREDRPSSGYVHGLNLVDMPKFAKNLAAHGLDATPGAGQIQTPSRARQAKKAMDEVLAAKPGNRAETNKLVKVADELVRFRADRGKWKELAQLADEFAAKLAGRYPDVRAKMTAQRLNALFRCDVDRLSAHLRDFSDTRLVLDAKRADWLKARYYAE